MMSFKLNSNSWHFKVANFGSDWGRICAYRDSNICEYTRAFLTGLFWMTLAASFTGAVLSWVCFSVGNIFSWLFLGYILAEAAEVFLIMIGVIAIALAMGGMIMGYKRYAQIRRTKVRDLGIVHEPGFVALAYRKFKDKTCFRIEFKRDGE